MKATLSLPRRPPALILVGVLDIMVLLLVFFILVAAANQQSGIMVSPAESEWRLSGYEDPISVTVQAGPEPVVYIGRTRVSRENFSAELEKAAERSDTDTVLMRVDEMASVAVERRLVEEALALGLRVALVGREPSSDVTEGARAAGLAPGDATAD